MKIIKFDLNWTTYRFLDSEATFLMLFRKGDEFSGYYADFS